MVQNRKNILFIAPYLHVGGGPKVLTDIAKAAGRGEFSFHIISTEPERDVWDRFRLYFDNVIVASERVANQQVCNKYFLELIERLKIDLVLITDSRHGYTALPLLKSKFGNIKIVDLLHSEKCWAASHDYGWVTPYIDKRVLISNYLKAFIVNRYRASGYGDEHLDRLEVIHNGVDFREYDAASGMKGKFKAKFGIDGDCKVISFVGRFSQEKNPILFLNIAKNVIMRSPSQKLKFVMAGDGPELRTVRDSVIRYGLGGNVILPGMVNSIPELLADTHLLLIVSTIEGIPLVIEEALAMKVPVLSIDVGAVRELIKNEVNGFIIDQGANVVEQFTDTILDLLVKKEKYEALASRTRESLVPEFLTETTGENYRKLFQELLA